MVVGEEAQPGRNRPAATIYSHQIGKTENEANIKDEVPWSESLTSYDREHFTIYRRILDACADNASVEELADLILGIDPALEPVPAVLLQTFQLRGLRHGFPVICRRVSNDQGPPFRPGIWPMA